MISLEYLASLSWPFYFTSLHCLCMLECFCYIVILHSTCQSMTLHIEPRTFLTHLWCISEALPCTLTHCISDSACYTTLHHPLHPHLHTCCLCLFVYLFVYLCYWCMCCLFVCLSVSPSRLFLLIDGQWTGAKSNCTHSIRRGLGRRLRSSFLLKSSPRCDLPCRIVY